MKINLEKIAWSILFVLFIVLAIYPLCASAAPLGGTRYYPATRGNPYWVNPYGPVVIINQPRPVYIQHVAPPRPLTKTEREQLQGVYRGTDNATPTYGGGPVIIYNPWVKQ